MNDVQIARMNAQALARWAMDATNNGDVLLFAVSAPPRGGNVEISVHARDDILNEGIVGDIIRQLHERFASHEVRKVRP